VPIVQESGQLLPERFVPLVVMTRHDRLFEQQVLDLLGQLAPSADDGLTESQSKPIFCCAHIPDPAYRPAVDSRRTGKFKCLAAGWHTRSAGKRLGRVITGPTKRLGGKGKTPAARPDRPGVWGDTGDNPGPRGGAWMNAAGAQTFP
jgi:hypothetical protein